MDRLYQTNHNRRKGFTLTETLLVVIIVGVIASMAFPHYLTIIEKTHSSEGAQILYALLAAQKRHFLDEGSYASNIADLDIDFRDSPYFNDPVARNTDPLGTITRTGSYTLSILKNGTITCSGGSNNICGKMGF